MKADKSTVDSVNSNPVTGVAQGWFVRNIRWRHCALFIAGPLLLANAIKSGAQEAEPATAAPTLEQTQILYVEMPVPLVPELDPVLPAVPPALNPETDPEFIARMDVITSYESALEQIELDGGAWNQALIEELATLGVLQQQQGNHAEAIEIFDRAIHVNRINSGLHTLEQIANIERMIDSYLALGDWAQADTYFDYLFYIQQRAYGPNDPRMIPVLDRLATWNIQAFNIGYGEALGFRLNSAQIMQTAAATMVSVHFGDDDERYISYRRNLANSAFLASRHPELIAQSQQQDYRNAEDILLSKLDAGGLEQIHGFQAGELALREIVSYYAKQEAAQFELASALADLGDWYLMFERRRDAENLYIEAWEILQQSDHSNEWIQQLFGQVVPIPTFGNAVANLLTQPITTSDGKTVNYSYADVVFDVMVSGTTRNIEILTEATAVNSSLLSRLQREIRGAYFRPRIENGQLQRSDRNYFRYRYWY